MRTTISSVDLVPNEPNASHLFESLRYSGYSNQEAIADIIDNSIDAGATNIWIIFDEAMKGKKDIIIDIYDDGEGMDKDTLDEALKLGSNSKKSVITKLGKAGMGLKTAGTSIARTIEVYTKRKDSEKTYYSSYDGNLIEKENRWVKVLTEADKKDLSDVKTNKVIDSKSGEVSLHYAFSAPNQGTLIRLSNCDRLTYAHVGHLKNALKKHLGEIFRKYLDAGKKIYIDGELVEIIDPLFTAGLGEGGERPNVQEIPFKLLIDGKKISFDVRVSILPETTLAKADLLGINIKNQGFYIVRNNRQIDRALTLDLFAKHNNCNRIRAEVLFSGDLDEFMGINFAKKGIQPRHEIVDAIREKVYNPIIVPQKKISSSQEQVDIATKRPPSHATPEKTFIKKGSLLIKSFTPKDVPKEITQKKQKEIVIEHPEIAEDLENCFPIKFINDKSMYVDDLIFKCEQIGDTTIVKLNVKHPFYQAYLEVDEEGREPLDFLIGTLAMAKLRLDEGMQEVVEHQLFRDVSLNLKQLLS
jgi:hypothetical protein